MSKKEKEIKTNAMRILEKNKIEFEIKTYECDEFVDGIHIADMLNQPYEMSFKTLVMQGKSGEYHVFVLPVDREVDLKKAAKAVGEKSIEMLKSKELLPLTGYVHGGCSPIGMKKFFRTTIHSSALEFDRIYFSGGRIGCQIETSLENLKKIIKVDTAEIISE